MLVKLIIQIWQKGGFMQNYTGVLFIILMERKIQRKFQIRSSLATLMQRCTYVLNDKHLQKLNSFFTAFDMTRTIFGMMLIFIFYWLQWGDRFSTKVSWIYLCSNQTTARDVWISKLQRKRRFLFRCLNSITSLLRTENSR